MGALSDGLNAFSTVDNMFRGHRMDAMREKQFEQQQALNTQQSQLNDLRIDKAERDNDMADFNAWAPAFLERADKGRVTADDFNKLGSYKRLGIDVGAMADPEYDYHLDLDKRILSGEQKIDSPETKDSLNVIWKNRIKRGVGEKTKDGRTIVDKNIDTIVFNRKKNTFSFGLRVDYDDGTHEVSRPVTDGRSADAEKDPFVAEYTLDDVMKNVTAQKVITKAMDATGVRDQVRAAYMGQNASSNLRLQNQMMIEQLKAKYRMTTAEAEHQLRMQQIAAQQGSNLATENLRYVLNLDTNAAKQAGTNANDIAAAQAKDPMMSPLSPNYVSPEVANARGAVQAGRATAQQVQLAKQHDEKVRQASLMPYYEKAKNALSPGVFGGVEPTHEAIAEEANKMLQAEGYQTQDFSFISGAKKVPTPAKGGNLSGSEKPATKAASGKPDAKVRDGKYYDNLLDNLHKQQ